MKLKRNHAMTPTPHDPRYPIHGVRIVGHAVRSCRVCGCTDNDCSGCIERTGEACSWAGDDLCSACVEHVPSFFSLKPGERGKSGAVAQ